MSFRRKPGGIRSLGLHLVWCPNYRRGVLGGRVAGRCGELLGPIADKRGWQIVAKEVMPDRVHLYVRIGPTDAPAAVVQTFKGHFACSVGYVSESTVRSCTDHQWDAVAA